MTQQGSPSGNDTPRAISSGVPSSRASDTFETFEIKRNPTMKPALEACKRVASGDNWCALMVGGYGTGKTHLAIAAMNEYELSSRFWKVPDYLEFVKHMAFDRNFPLDDVIGPYRTGRFLLVLDDLGVENHTDWASEQLYRVLDSRYDNRLPTIVTSNVPPARLDPRIMSRYAEGLIVCKGRDVRRPNKATSDE